MDIETTHNKHTGGVESVTTQEPYYFNLKENDNQSICVGGHKIDGKTPMLTDVHLDKKTCDCGRLVYKAERCGCPEGGTLELKQYPNE